MEYKFGNHCVLSINLTFVQRFLVVGAGTPEQESWYSPPTPCATKSFRIVVRASESRTILVRVLITDVVQAAFANLIIQ